MLTLVTTTVKSRSAERVPSEQVGCPNNQLYATWFMGDPYWQTTPPFTLESLKSTIQYVFVNYTSDRIPCSYQIWVVGGLLYGSNITQHGYPSLLPIPPPCYPTCHPALLAVDHAGASHSSLRSTVEETKRLICGEPGCWGWFLLVAPCSAWWFFGVADDDSWLIVAKKYQSWLWIINARSSYQQTAPNSLP